MMHYLCRQPLNYGTDDLKKYYLCAVNHEFFVYENLKAVFAGVIKIVPSADVVLPLAF